MSAKKAMRDGFGGGNIGGYDDNGGYAAAAQAPRGGQGSRPAGATGVELKGPHGASQQKPVGVRIVP